MAEGLDRIPGDGIGKVSARPDFRHLWIDNGVVQGFAVGTLRDVKKTVLLLGPWLGASGS